MRGISKAMARTVGGLAVAGAVVAGGAGVASAATVSPTTHTATTSWHRFTRGQWNLNGPNTVKATYRGRIFTYSVTFRQFGSYLSGTLTDPYYPATGPVSGAVFGNHVSFSFRYPSGSTQGLRTYTATISSRGYVSGRWSDSGSDHARGAFALVRPARPMPMPFREHGHFHKHGHYRMHGHFREHGHYRMHGH